MPLADPDETGRHSAGLPEVCGQGNRAHPQRCPCAGGRNYLRFIHQFYAGLRRGEGVGMMNCDVSVVTYAFAFFIIMATVIACIGCVLMVIQFRRDSRRHGEL